MSQINDDLGGFFRDISENLGGIFRYFLPGAVIIGATYIAYPTNQAWPKSADPWVLLVLAIVTLVVGNTWLVLNRYIVHQLIDLILYHLGYDGPAKKKEKLPGSPNYIDALGRFIRESHLISPESKALRKYVSFRASSVLLMYTIGELAILFSFLNEGGNNFFSRNAWAISIGGLIVFGFAIWQNVITRRIDWYTVYPPEREGKSISNKNTK